MRTQAKVVEVNNGYARVVSQRSDACSSCHNCEGKDACSAHLLFGESTSKIELEAKNTVNANVGDMVVLEASTQMTLFLSIVLFVLPLVLSFICYLVSFEITGKSDVSVVVLAVSFALFFVICAKVCDEFAKKRVNIEIVKIVQESAEL